MSRRLERGQSLLLWSLVLVLVIFPMLAFGIDQGSLYWARRERQKLVDAACLDGAIARHIGQNARTAVINSLTNHGIPTSFYDPPVGTGTTLSKGIEVGNGEVRVAIWGETLSWFSQFIPGSNGWEIGARARCDIGIGGPLPLTLKECELASGATRCINPDGTVNYVPGWRWGDEMALAGQQHDPNISTGMSYSGLVAPDIRCLRDDDQCASKWWVPPVPPGTPPNTIKDITRGYILRGGYDGPAPVPGENLGALDGVSNHMLAQAVRANYNVGDVVLVMVYNTGEVYDGNANYDYVKIIGYTFVRITRYRPNPMNPNTVLVVPLDTGICNDPLDPTPQDDIIANPDIANALFNMHPILLPWDYSLGGAGSVATGSPTCN